MNMFRSFGTWAACAALLASGLFALDMDTTAPKSPIAVKAQDGEVLGSLGRTIDKWIPNVNVNAGFQSKFFNRGLMLDTNAHAGIDVNFSWLPTENSRLSIGINGDFPTRKSHKKVSVIKLSQGKILTDENGIPIAYPYYEDAFGYFGETWNQNVLLGQDPYTPVFQKSIFFHEDMQILSDKINYTNLREKKEFDERQIKIEYTYTFQDIPVVGDVTISGGFTFLRDNDIYSKLKSDSEMMGYDKMAIDQAHDKIRNIMPLLSQKYSELTSTINEIRNDIYDYIFDYENYTVSYIYYQDIFKAIGEELYPASQYPGLASIVVEYLGALAYLTDLYEQFGDLDPNGKQFFAELDKLIDDWKEAADALAKAQDYKIRRNYSIKRRDQRREELNLGFSFDNILNSNTMTLNPNMRLNFETNGHLWMQYGIFFSLSLNKLSDKLTWDTSLDSYWFDHDYFKVSECNSYYVVDNDGKIDYEKTSELLKINSAFIKSKHVSHSTSGFKTLTARTSLNYAISPNITISPNISAVHRFDILDKTADNQKYMGDNDFIWYGINLNYAF